MTKNTTTLKGLNPRQTKLLDLDFWNPKQFAVFMGSGDRNFTSTKCRNDPTFPKPFEVQANRLRIWKVSDAITWAEDYLTRPSKRKLGLKYNMSAPTISMRSISENLTRKTTDAKIPSASKLGYSPLLMQTSSPYASVYYFDCTSEIGSVVRIRPEGEKASWGD